MPQFEHDGLRFHYLDIGGGFPFVFQHGLGGDVSQTSGIFKPPAGIRLLTFDCRGHGETVPLGDENRISLAQFADDMAAMMDELGVRQAIVGGISMGAAVAVNFAERYAHRVLGLILSRPAWLHRPNPDTVRVFGLIARLIREHGPRHGKELFLQSSEYQQVRQESPDGADSLAGQFDNPRAEETVAKLERIPPDHPCESLAVLGRINVPVMVLANRQDPIHPFEYGRRLSEAVPGAMFRELTPKSADKDRHAADVQQYLEEFLGSFVSLRG